MRSELQKQPWENWDVPGVVDWLDADWLQLGVDPVLSALVDLVELNHGSGPILDVGCGTGRIHDALMRRLVLRPFGYVGVDVTPGMVKRAKARFPSAVFRVASVFDLPFPADSFGSVVSVDVLQHLPEIETPLEQMLRVTHEHLFLLLWLRKADDEPRPAEIVSIDISGHDVRAEFYEVAYSDEEVITSCEAAGGEVLDFQVIDDVNHDFGLLRVGLR